ncbi:MAG: isoamylase early set domain-containing protein [Actinomycetota bacterium]|nr:isoamylase early set domain-containing protein [Actinomycetota bacterium]MDQ2846653.1 isoamylase early set domain-containing protein [Actinomycetota bacterium]
MAIRVKTDPSTGQTKLQFVLPDDVHDGPVSAVGTFNGWQPGAHKLVRRSNGTRSVTVAVPAGERVHFRYLGSGGVWFDDPDAYRVSGGLLDG